MGFPLPLHAAVSKHAKHWHWHWHWTLELQHVGECLVAHMQEVVAAVSSPNLHRIHDGTQTTTLEADMVEAAALEHLRFEA